MRKHALMAAVCGSILIGTVALGGGATADPVSAERLPAPAGAFPGTNGLIAFEGFDGSDTEIYTINPDGSGLTQLTNNIQTDLAPSWNARGTKIAWLSEGDVWTMNANGSNATPIYTASNSYSVGWSPSGRRLVVSRDTPGGPYDLFVINRDGSGGRNITRTPWDESDPVWSPDGTLIGMDVPGASGHRVATIRPDGTHLARLTPNGDLSYMGGWSPNGRQIVYASLPSGGSDYEVYRMSKTGQNQTALTNNAWEDEGPTYSPDGAMLLWVDNFDGDYEVVRAPVGNPAGLTQLTFNTNSDFLPDWQALS